MNGKLLLGAICVCLGLADTASAQPRDLREEAYDYGWDEAGSFCQDLRYRPFERRRTGDITRTFTRECKRGFDAHINNNRSCRQRMARENAYRDMWDARRSACD